MSTMCQEQHSWSWTIMFVGNVLWQYVIVYIASYSVRYLSHLFQSLFILIKLSNQPYWMLQLYDKVVKRNISSELPLQKLYLKGKVLFHLSAMSELLNWTRCVSSVPWICSHKLQWTQKQQLIKWQISYAAKLWLYWQWHLFSYPRFLSNLQHSPLGPHTLLVERDQLTYSFMSQSSHA